MSEKIAKVLFEICPGAVEIALQDAPLNGGCQLGDPLTVDPDVATESCSPLLQEIEAVEQPRLTATFGPLMPPFRSLPARLILSSVMYTVGPHDLSLRRLRTDAMAA